MNESILVVGGAGYIGSHMLLALRNAGHTVTVFDNLSRGFSDAVLDTPLVRGDLRMQDDLHACFSSHQIDLVMHFAALANVAESVADPEAFYTNNVVGTLNLLAAMRTHQVKSFVFSSSCATYGEPIHLPISEQHGQHPINPYGKSKLMVEQILSDYATAYGLCSISLRYFNAAGCDSMGRVGERHCPETHLIPLILGEALRLKKGGDPAMTLLKVFGTDFPTRDGSCIRDYIHVQDLCLAHLRAAERLLQKRADGAEQYNLANGAGYSVLEVIQACRDVTKQPINFHSLPRRAGDPAILVGDATKAGKVLNWKPEYSDLHSMIASAWAWTQQADLVNADQITLNPSKFTAD